MFVIYFSSVENFGTFNAYGFYCGETRTEAKETYPICMPNKDSSYVKWYSSKKIAENAADKISGKCAYVVAWRVEEV